MKSKSMALIGALTLVLTGGFFASVANATGVCPELDSGKIDTTGDPATVSYTAPEGKLVSEYCVKAGSEESGGGVRMITVNTPAKSVTIDHPDVDSVSHYSVTWVNEEDDTPNFCDRADKPGGVSIGQWLDNDNGGSAAECFEADIIESCGTIDGSVTGPTGIAWGMQWTEGAAVAAFYPAEDFPKSFDEDYNGGSVDVSYWLVGGESDYGKRSGLPNLWGTSATLTVNTDCEEETDEPKEPKEPTTEKDETVLCSGWVKTVITATDADGNESVETEWEHDASLQTCDDGENG